MDNASVAPYDKLDGLARWFGSSVAAAFFSSLERFSCVHLATYDTDEDEDDEEFEEANGNPSSAALPPTTSVDENHV